MKTFANIALCLAAAAPALAVQPAAEIRQRIIRESIAAYPGPGACPYTVSRSGMAAGPRSAWHRPGSYRPKCYPADVTDAEVRAWREAHR